MDGALVKEIGTKALLAGAGTLVLFWSFNAVKLIINARGINPLIKKFFNQIAAGRFDAAYLLTSKNFRRHVKSQDFKGFLLKDLKLFLYRNMKAGGRPRIKDDQITLTVTLKTEDKKSELPLDFTFIKFENTWRIDRISKIKSQV